MNRILAAAALALHATPTAHAAISEAAGMAKFDFMERAAGLLKGYGEGPDATMAKALALLGTPCQIAFVSVGISIEERALGKAKDPAAEAAAFKAIAEARPRVGAAFKQDTASFNDATAEYLKLVVDEAMREFNAETPDEQAKVKEFADEAAAVDVVHPANLPEPGTVQECAG